MKIPPIRLGPYRFAPGLWPSVAFALVFPLLLGLGLLVERCLGSGRAALVMAGSGIGAMGGSYLAGYQWEFNLIESDQVNAWCMPGGKVVVYTGILPICQDDTGVAVVMGHEIAHAELRHSSLRLQKAFGADALLKFIILGTPVGITDVVNAQIMAELMTLSYGRGQEAQSDEHSVRYLSSGPYACDGAAGFFAKIIAEGDDKRIPEILSSHPDPAARVRDIRDAARELGVGHFVLLSLWLTKAERRDSPT